MAWGLVNRKEVEAMFEERRREDRRMVNVEIAKCNARHDEHAQLREEDRKVQTEAITKLTEAINITNSTLSKYLPNLIDAEEKRATKHQLKEGALLISAILGAIITIGTVLLFVSAYFNGYFIK